MERRARLAGLHTTSMPMRLAVLARRLAAARQATAAGGLPMFRAFLRARWLEDTQL